MPSTAENFGSPFQNGGTLGRQLAAHDWSRTPLGALGGWPGELSTALSLVLGMPFPCLLLWGDDRVLLPNQEAVELLGSLNMSLRWGEPVAIATPSLEQAVAPALQQVCDTATTAEISVLLAATVIRLTCQPVPVGSTVSGVLVYLCPEDPPPAPSEPCLDESTLAALKPLIEAVPLATWVAHDRHCHQVTANQAAYELLEIPPGTPTTATPASGQYPFPFEIHCNGKPVAPEQLPLQRAARDGITVDERVELLFPDGRVRRLWGKAVPLWRDGAACGAVATFMDITDWEKAVAALAISEQRFRLAARAIDGIIYEWEVVSDAVYRSEGLEQLLGYPPQQVEPTNAWWIEHMHPEDRQRLAPALAALMATGGDRYGHEYRMRHRQGHWVHVWDQGYLVRDQAGELVRVSGSCLNISDRKRVAAELEQTNQVLQAIIDGSQDAIFVKDRQGRYVIVNAVAADWIHARNQPILGTTDADWFTPEIARQIMAADRQVVQMNAPTSFEEQVTFETEERFLMTRKYPWRALDGSVKGVIGISQDVTLRKQSEIALRLNERRYRTLANAVPHLMWMNSAEGDLQFCNLHWNQYVAVPDNVSPQLWQRIVHPEDLEQVRQTRQQAIPAGQSYELEIRLSRLDQKYRWHLARVVPLRDDQGQVVNWFGTATDIHDQKRALIEREQLLTLERQARDRAEAANRIKDEFLAVLSHELRTPLNPVLGWVTLLSQRRLDEARQRKALEVIERNVKLQLQLIDDLLDVSKILRGKLRLKEERVNVSQAIRGAAETLQLAAAAKSIDIQLELGSEPIYVLGDETRLQQIVWNLLSNAVKFTPEAGQVSVHLSRDQRRAEIRVVDTGKGIEPKFLPHVFESFRQEDGATTRNFGGLGLGLAIVRYLSEMHGGTVCAESDGPGQGAIFTVRLPLAPPPSTTTDKTAVAVTAESLQGVRVLLVEDRLDTQDFLTFFLRSQGMQVRTVDSAQEALAAIEQGLPDVLISDIAMPEMDGYELMRQLRSQPTTAAGRLPAIALTAYAGSGDVRQALEVGFQRHLAKPIDTEQLLAALRELLADSQNQA